MFSERLKIGNKVNKKGTQTRKQKNTATLEAMDYRIALEEIF